MIDAGQRLSPVTSQQISSLAAAFRTQGVTITDETPGEDEHGHYTQLTLSNGASLFAMYQKVTQDGAEGQGLVLHFDKQDPVLFYGLINGTIHTGTQAAAAALQASAPSAGQ